MRSDPPISSATQRLSCSHAAVPVSVVCLCASRPPAAHIPWQGKRSLYLGAVGAGARMKLVVNMTMGSMMGEGLLCAEGHAVNAVVAVLASCVLE